MIHLDIFLKNFMLLSKQLFLAFILLILIVGFNSTATASDRSKKGVTAPSAVTTSQSPTSLGTIQRAKSDLANYPGNVSGANLWLKANEGVTTVGTTLSGWSDFTFNNTFSITGAPILTNNAINFNPQVTIVNTQPNTILPSNRLDGSTPIPFVEGFAVYRSNTMATCLVGGELPGNNYGVGIFLADSHPEVGVSNGSSASWAKFTNNLYAQYGISNLEISPVASPYTAGRYNGVPQTMTWKGGSPYSTFTFTPMIGGTNNNGNGNGWFSFDGDVAEIILYPQSLSSGEKLRIESYLAVKYGISLDTLVQNYLSSNGSVIWNNKAYWHDVFGIGRDDASSLNQTSSNSFNTGSGDGTGQNNKGNIVIKNPSSLSNEGYLMVGNNNDPLSLTSSDLPTSQSDKMRIKREWKAKLSGTVGTIDLSFDLNGITVTGSQTSDFKLLVDTDGDGDFTTGSPSVINATSYTSGIVGFTSISLTDNSVFTIITGAQPMGPAGITGPSLWLKSDNGVSFTGNNLDNWTDQTGLNTFSKTGNIGYSTQALNFNPQVTIANAHSNTVLPVNRLAGTTPIEYVDGFAVYRNNSDTTCLVGGVNPGNNYGVGIFLADSDPEVGVSNGTSGSWAEFTNQNYTKFGISNLDVSATLAPYIYGRYNGAPQSMSWKGGTPYTNIVFTPMIGGTNNNGNSSGWFPFDGDVSEIVLYPKSLNNESKLKIESYLAVKYGISLDSIVQNYLSSNGTVIWNNKAYWHDVFGIGRDDTGGLNQSIANSYNTGSGNGTGQNGKLNLVISNPSSLNSGDYLMIGNNNDALSVGFLDLPATNYDNLRIKREWKVKHTGSMGTVDLSFNLNGISGIGSSITDFKLLIDTDGDGDFTTGVVTTINASSFVSGIVVFNSVTLSDNVVFTLITGIQTEGPAGVRGPSLWLKANDGALATGNNLTGWVDKAGINNFTTVGNIGYNNNTLNFNPVISFTNDNSKGSNINLPANRLDGDHPIQFTDGFAVFKSIKQNSGPADGHTEGAFYTVVGSTVVGPAYGPGIFVGDNKTPRLQVGSGNHEYYQYFLYPTFDKFNVTNLDISPSAAPFASGRLNGANQTMLYDGPNEFSSITITPMIGGSNNNGSTYGIYALDGEVAEVALYPKSLSTTNKLKVESYLAIKYGITLDPTVSNYISSSGTTIWNQAAYWNDVFGIGKDNASGLNQTSSNSINTGSGDGSSQSAKGNIVLSNANGLNDGDYLLIGRDNAGLTEQTTELPTASTRNKRIAREWKVQRTGNVGSLSLAFSTLDLSLSGSTVNDFALLIDNDGDGDFTTGTVTDIAATAYSGNVVTFDNVTLPNLSLFTIAMGNIPTAAKETSLRLAIYPNPTKGDIRVNLGRFTTRASVSVYDVTGNKVKDAEFSLTDSFNLSIDNAPGIYFVEIDMDGNTHKFKVVKL